MVLRTHARMSADDFARVAPLLGPCELVGGEIVFMSPGGIGHSRVAVNVTFVVESYARRRGLGRVLGNEAGLVVAERPDTVRGADVAYISYRRLPLTASWEGFLRHPPELVVEVLGQDVSWEQMEAKVAEYRHFGVDLIWVVDPHTRAMRVYRRRGEAQILHERDVVQGGRVLPGFRCKVAELFRA